MLTIEDPEVIRLAEVIAQAKGQTPIQAVVEALRESYERMEKKANKPSVEELMEIASRAASLRKGPFIDHAEYLYDENGLPK